MAVLAGLSRGKKGKGLLGECVTTGDCWEFTGGGAAEVRELCLCCKWLKEPAVHSLLT